MCNKESALFEEFNKKYPDVFHSVVYQIDENERRRALKSYSNKLIEFILEKKDDTDILSISAKDISETLGNIFT